MIQFDLRIFFQWVGEKPPTSKFMASQPTPPQRTAPTEIAGRLWSGRMKTHDSDPLRPAVKHLFLVEGW